MSCWSWSIPSLINHLTRFIAEVRLESELFLLFPFLKLSHLNCLEIFVPLWFLCSVIHGWQRSFRSQIRKFCSSGSFFWRFLWRLFCRIEPFSKLINIDLLLFPIFFILFGLFQVHFLFFIFLLYLCPDVAQMTFFFWRDLRLSNLLFHRSIINLFLALNEVHSI